MISITITTYDLFLLLATVAFFIWHLSIVAEEYIRTTSTARSMLTRFQSPFTIPNVTRLNTPNPPTAATNAHHDSTDARHTMPGSFHTGVAASPSHDRPNSLQLLFDEVGGNPTSNPTEPPRSFTPSEDGSLFHDTSGSISGARTDRLAVHAAHSAPSTSISHERTLIDSPLAIDEPLLLATTVDGSTSVLGELANDPTGDQQVDVAGEGSGQVSIGKIPDEDSASDTDELPVMIESGERMSFSEARPRLFASQGIQTVPLPPSERVHPVLPSDQISALSLVLSHPTPIIHDLNFLPEETLSPASSTSGQNSIPFPSSESPHIAESREHPPPIPARNPRRRGTVPSRPPFLSRSGNQKRSDAELSTFLARSHLSDTRPLFIDKGKAREVLQGDDDPLIYETTDSPDSLAPRQASIYEPEPMDTESSPKSIPELARPSEFLQFPGAGWAATIFLDDAVPLMHGTMYSGCIFLATTGTPARCSVHRIRGHEYKLKNIAWRADSPIPEPTLVLDEHSLDATYTIHDQQCQCKQGSRIVRIRDVVQAGSDICILTDPYDGTLHQLLASLQDLPPDRWAMFVFNCLSDIWSGMHEMHSMKIFHRNITANSILYKSSGNNFYLGDFFDAVHNPGPDKEVQLMKNDFRALLHLISSISWRFLVLHNVEVEKSLVDSLKGILAKLIDLETDMFKATVNSKILARLNFMELR